MQAKFKLTTTFDEGKYVQRVLSIASKKAGGLRVQTSKVHITRVAKGNCKNIQAKL